MPGSGTDRLFRGGAWNTNAVCARAAYRSHHRAPDWRADDIGLHLARTRP